MNEGKAIGSLIGLGLLVAAAIWLLFGIYTIDAGHQGVKLRFGRIVETVDPGIGYNLPWPLGRVEEVNVDNVRQVRVGFIEGENRAGQFVQQNKSNESLMLTGDENIVDVEFRVLWQITDPVEFLYNVVNTKNTIKDVAESAMREVVGQSGVDAVLTENRAQIAVDVLNIVQDTLNVYKAGVLITEINIERVDPPPSVVAAYQDVQDAETDKEKYQNQAEGYKNKIVPEAQAAAYKIENDAIAEAKRMVALANGEAIQKINDAEAYKVKLVNEAHGTAERFTEVLARYSEAKEVTLARLRLEVVETMAAKNSIRFIDNVPVLPFLDADKNSN